MFIRVISPFISINRSNDYHFDTLLNRYEILFKLEN